MRRTDAATEQMKHDFNLAAFPLHGCEWPHLMHAMRKIRRRKLNEKDFDGCPMGTAVMLAGCGRDPGTERGNRPTRPSRAAGRAGPARLAGPRGSKGHKGTGSSGATRTAGCARRKGRSRSGWHLHQVGSGQRTRSVAKQVKSWCRCSVRLAAHPTAQSAVQARPSAFVSRSRSRPTSCDPDDDGAGRRHESVRDWFGPDLSFHHRGRRVRQSSAPALKPARRGPIEKRMRSSKEALNPGWLDLSAA